jgi:uncharacterized protein
MVSAFARRIVLLGSVVCGIGFALIYLHALVAPTQFSRPLAAAGAVCAILASLLTWLGMVKTDDYLTGKHLTILMATAAILIGATGIGLLGFFYGSGAFSTSYLVFFGLAPMLMAAGFVMLAWIRIKEAPALPHEYHAGSTGGFWGGASHLIVALPLVGLAMILLFRTIQDIRHVPESISTLQDEAVSGRPTSQEAASLRADQLLRLGKELQVQNNYRRAHDVFEEAAALGSIDAVFNLALIYSGDGFLRNPPLALQHLQQAAGAGHVEASFRFGKALRLGELGALADPVAALPFLEQAADRGHIEAQKQLANMHNRGEGTRKDPALAYSWFRRAAEQGDAVAQNDVGIFLLNGTGVESDLEEGLRWLKMAAEQDVTVAQYNLGQSYYTGSLGRQDYSIAFLYFLKLANKGIPYGHLMTGLQLLNGWGVDQDERAAFEAFAAGARRGDLESEYWLGYCWLNAIGTDPDATEGLARIESAANRAHADAQLLLGRIYWDGVLLLQDKVEAVKWLSLAAANGSGEADKLLQEVAPLLTPSERFAASGLVAAFKQQQRR